MQLLLCFALSGVFGAIGIAAPVYHVTSLGGLANPGPTITGGLNNNNQVVIREAVPNFVSPHAALWSNGTSTDISPGSAERSDGIRVNDVGQVVGTLGGFGTQRKAAIFSNGSITVVPVGAGVSANGLGINSSGDIVGETFHPDGSRHGFLFAGGVFTSLGTDAGWRNRAIGINDSGVIIGNLETLDFSRTSGYVLSGGIRTSLGLGGLSSIVEDINNAGQAVGRAQNASGEWRGFVYQGGVITDLGTFLPVGINDFGDMVGSTPSGFALRIGGVVQPLVLDAAGAPYPITILRDINNNGAIAADGTGQFAVGTPYLLTLVSDVPEPGTIGTAATVLMFLALVRRRSL